MPTGYLIDTTLQKLRAGDGMPVVEIAFEKDEFPTVKKISTY